MLIYAYKFASKSAKALSQALGARRIRTNSTTFIGRARKTVINWGCSELPPEVLKCNVLNNPEAVGLASNKLSFFNAMSVHEEVNTPPWATTAVEAQGWLEKSAVVERHKLQGYSGEGIVIVERGGELSDAPLYVKYIPKKEEYRVHVFKGQVLDVQRKARVIDTPDEEVNWKVRNLAGGFIFARNDDHTPSPLVLEQAVAAVNACGLDFGAVDIVWNDKQQRAYVLEVNTAPGLMGTTLEKYEEAFRGV